MPEQLDIGTLLKVVIREADEHYDGHFTLLAFTTGFKCAFGTPDLDSGQGGEQVRKLPNHEKLQEALVDLILNKPSFYS
ncbi:MAG: hypothetical protein U9R11_01985 [Chloroflexota bacterium]|nr:hypothetical protein [Chloroflexota bacterium]